MNRPRIRIYNTLDDLNQSLVTRWSALAGRAIKDRGSFHVALAGGSTPMQLYQLLASRDIQSTLPWQQTHVYFGDERCVPPDHVDSNFRMANQALFGHVPLPSQNIHRIAGENPDHAQAAADYQQVLIQHLPFDDDGYHFDLVLLGLGADGHIASLFPDTTILDRRDCLAAAVFVEKLDRWRISITFPLFEQARHVLLAVAGSDKADIINTLLGTGGGTGQYPAQRISQHSEWYLDREAASRLPSELQSGNNDDYDHNTGC